MIPTMTYAERYGLREWMVGGVWVQLGSRDMETGSLLDVFLFLISLLLFFGSRPGTNGVGMGFYHLPLEVELPHAPDPPKGCQLSCTDRLWDFGFVRLRT